MAYPYRFTTEAKTSIRNCLDHLYDRVGGTGNPQAAIHFLKSLDDAIQNIITFPRGYGLCEEPELQARGQRKIHFRDMSYKIFYRIEGEEIIIDLVTHDLQDYLQSF